MEGFDQVFDRFGRAPFMDVPAEETAQIFAGWLIDEVLAGPPQPEWLLGRWSATGDDRPYNQARELLHRLATQGALSEINARQQRAAQLYRDMGLKVPGKSGRRARRRRGSGE